jgi:hypothetical protein
MVLSFHSLISHVSNRIENCCLTCLLSCGSEIVMFLYWKVFTEEATKLGPFPPAPPPTNKINIP